jgi:hypothetical protein
VPGKYSYSDTELESVALPDVWFGAPIFKSNYIRFDYDTRAVAIAPKYVFYAEPLTLNGSQLW